MERRTEEGDALLKLLFSIVTHDPIHWYYIIMQQIKQSSISYIHNTDGVIKEKNNKRKRKKVQSARRIVHDGLIIITLFDD